MTGVQTCALPICEDLYYRIDVIELRVPPLRERREDIPELAMLTLERLPRRSDLSTPTLSDAALGSLLAYNFPGNVRELENILERALALSSEAQISPEDLQLRPPPQAPGVTTGEEGGLGSQVEQVERQAIQKALEQARFNKTAAARLLGISFRALRYRMEKLGLK